MEGRCGNTHNREFMLIDAHGFADHGWIGSVLGTPVPVTDHCDWIGARRVAILGRQEQPPGFGFHSQHSEKITGNQFAPDAFGMVILAYAECRYMGDSNAVEELQTIT